MIIILEFISESRFYLIRKVMCIFIEEDMIGEEWGRESQQSLEFPVNKFIIM